MWGDFLVDWMVFLWRWWGRLAGSSRTGIFLHNRLGSNLSPVLVGRRSLAIGGERVSPRLFACWGRDCEGDVLSPRGELNMAGVEAMVEGVPWKVSPGRFPRVSFSWVVFGLALALVDLTHV